MKTTFSVASKKKKKKKTTKLQRSIHEWVEIFGSFGGSRTWGGPEPCARRSRIGLVMSPIAIVRFRHQLDLAKIGQ